MCCRQAREYPEAEKTLRLAAHLLIKAVLQYLPVLVPQPDFGECWQRVLQVLQVCASQSLSHRLLAPVTMLHSQAHRLLGRYAENGT